jgi:hypothetical protein
VAGTSGFRPKRTSADRDWLTLWSIGRYDLGCSESDFWQLTYEEFDALCKRDLERRDQEEYFAALQPWALYNIHRSANSPARTPQEFMFLQQTRLRLMGEDQPATAAPAVGTPALLLAPAPPSGMRWALPGERPPSKYAPGTRDDVIERFDNYSAAWHAGKVRR